MAEQQPSKLMTRVRFPLPAPVSMEEPTPFGAGLVLTQEEHEQNGDDAFRLLVAQLELQCQFEHWISPDDRLAERSAVELRSAVGRACGVHQWSMSQDRALT